MIAPFGTIAANAVIAAARGQPLVTDILIMAGLLVVFGIAAEFISKGTEKFEDVMGQGMAGGVILGLMAALPETIFVIIAVAEGAYAVAVGTALGGNIILFTLGIGLVAVAYFAKWKKGITMKEDYHIEIAFLIAATLALLILLVYGRLDAASGVLLILLYVSYVVYRYTKVHSRIMRHVATEKGRREFLEGVLLMAIGSAIVVLFSSAFIATIIGIAGTAGIAAVWLALVIAPIASDFEEQLAAYRLTQRSQRGGSTAIVSFIGGKLENNTVLLGIIGIFAASPVYIGFAAPELIAVMVINTIAITILSRGRLTYMQGAVLILLYFATITAAFVV